MHRRTPWARRWALMRRGTDGQGEDVEEQDAPHDGEGSDGSDAIGCALASSLALTGLAGRRSSVQALLCVLCSMQCSLACKHTALQCWCRMAVHQQEAAYVHACCDGRYAMHVAAQGR